MMILVGFPLVRRLHLCDNHLYGIYSFPETLIGGSRFCKMYEKDGIMYPGTDDKRDKKAIFWGRKEHLAEYDAETLLAGLADFVTGKVSVVIN